MLKITRSNPVICTFDLQGTFPPCKWRSGGECAVKGGGNGQPLFVVGCGRLQLGASVV